MIYFDNSGLLSALRTIRAVSIEKYEILIYLDDDRIIEITSSHEDGELFCNLKEQK